MVVVRRIMVVFAIASMLVMVFLLAAESVFAVPFVPSDPFAQFVTPAPVCVTICSTITPAPTRTTVQLNPVFQTATAWRTPTPEMVPFVTAVSTVQGVFPTFTVIAPNGLYTYSCPASVYNGSCVRRNALPNGTTLPILTSDYQYCVNDGSYYRIKLRDSSGQPIWVAWKHVSNPQQVFGRINAPKAEEICLSGG